MAEEVSVEREAVRGSRYRRQPDPELSRMEILAGAAQCFMEHGFSGTSIDEIAHRISSTKGRIYHHYSSKVELFFDVYRAGMEMNFAAIAPYLDVDRPAVWRLWNMLRAHSRSMIETQAFQAVVWEGVEMFRKRALPESELVRLAELADQRHRYADQFRLPLEQARADGELTYRNTSIALNTVFMALNGPVFWFKHRDGESKQEIDDIVDECATYAMRSLGYKPHREADEDVFKREFGA